LSVVVAFPLQFGTGGTVSASAAATSDDIAGPAAPVNGASISDGGDARVSRLNEHRRLALVLFANDRIAYNGSAVSHHRRLRHLVHAITRQLEESLVEVTRAEVSRDFADEAARPLYDAILCLGDHYLTQMFGESAAAQMVEMARKGLFVLDAQAAGKCRGPVKCRTAPPTVPPVHFDGWGRMRAPHGPRGPQGGDA
jgi:hypothetical protein